MVRQSGWAIFGYILLVFAWGGFSQAPLTAEENNALRRGCSHPPMPPSGLSGVGTTTANISWTWDPTDCANTYTVKDAFLGDVVASGIPHPTTFYNDHSLNENTPYTRFVTATNGFGESGPSAEFKRYTLVDLRDFTLVPGDHQIEVSCIPPPNSTADKTGCKIRRTNKKTGVTTVVQDYAPKYQFTDLNLDPEVEYCYTIQYQNGDAIETGESYPKCAKPKDNHQALEVSCSGTHEHAVCVNDGVITFTYAFSATDPNKAMVAYVTDTPQAFISFGPETRTTPQFPDAHAGLYAKGGAGIFDIGTATVVQQTLSKLLRQRQQKVDKYKRSFNKIFDLEAKIAKKVKDEEDELPKLYDDNQGLDNWPKAQKKIGNVSEQIDNFKQDLGKEHGKLRDLRREIFQIDDQLEAAVAAGEMSSNDKCAIVKVDVKLPITDPVYNSREVLVQRDEIGPSNPRPVLILDPMTDGSIEVGTDRKARFTLSGTVTDALADVIKEDTGDIKTVKIFYNDQEISTVDTTKGGGDVSLLRPFAKKFQFQKQIVIDVQDAKRCFIRVESAANLIGNTGADLLKFVPLFDYSVSAGPQFFNVYSISLFLGPDGLRTDEVNQIWIKLGLSSLQGGETPMVETGLNSGVYSGVVDGLGFVSIQMAGVGGVSGFPRQMSVLMSSSVGFVSLRMDQAGSGERQYWNREAMQTPRESLVVQHASADSTEMGPRTTGGTFNPFYVRVVDPAGPGENGEFKDRPFNTKEREDLFNEIYFDKVIVVTDAAVLASVQNIMQDTPTSKLRYEACEKTVHSVKVEFTDGSGPTRNFVCLPASVIERLLIPEKGAPDPGVVAANVELLKEFTIKCGAGTGTIKGITTDKRLADAKKLSGKPILSIVGSLSKKALAQVESEILVVDETMMEVKVSDLVQDVEAVAVQSIEAFQMDRNQEVKLEWPDVILRGKNDALILNAGLGIRVTLSNDRDAGNMNNGLKTLVTLVRREAQPGAAATVVATNKAVAPKLTRQNNGRTFRGILVGTDIIGKLLQPRGTEHKPPQFTTLDYVGGPTSNFEDSTAIRKFFLGAPKWQENGVAQWQEGKVSATETRTVGGVATPVLLSSPNASFFQAGGVSYLQILGGSQRVGDVTTDYRLFRQIQVQADLLYFSGHGTHDPAAITLEQTGGATGFVPIAGLNLSDHWGESLKTVIIAGCSVLDLNVAANPALTTGNRDFAHPGWSDNPGNEFKATGPKLFLGYRAGAPSDTGGGIALATAFVANLNAGIQPTDYGKLHVAFRDAHLTAGPTRAVTSGGWRSYASIDVTAGKFYFFNQTVAGKDFYQLSGAGLKFVEGSINIP